MQYDHTMMNLLSTMISVRISHVQNSNEFDHILVREKAGKMLKSRRMFIFKMLITQSNF